MITPEFIGQIYRNTANGDVWQANSLTPGDWTKIAGTGGGGSNLDAAGDPTGVVTPEYLGQYYRDTTTGNIWKSTGATSADWTLQVQDFKLKWEPTSYSVQRALWMSSYAGLTGITKLVFEDTILGDTSIEESYDFEDCTDLVEISCPNATECQEHFWFKDCLSLSAVSAPNLARCTGSGHFDIENCGLTSIVLPAFVSGDISIHLCPSLTQISLPSFIPEDLDNITFSYNALDAATVNAVLAKCIASVAFTSGAVNLHGGTNAAPTGQGLTDKADLITRGVFVNTN